MSASLIPEDSGKKMLILSVVALLLPFLTSVFSLIYGLSIYDLADGDINHELSMILLYLGAELFLVVASLALSFYVFMIYVRTKVRDVTASSAIIMSGINTIWRGFDLLMVILAIFVIYSVI